MSILLYYCYYNLGYICLLLYTIISYLFFIEPNTVLSLSKRYVLFEFLLFLCYLFGVAFVGLILNNTYINHLSSTLEN
jgi:hypothetical protein